MSLEPKKARSVSSPDLVHCVHAFLVPTSAVIGLLYLIFSEFTISKFSTAGFIFVAWILILFVVTAIKRFLEKYITNGSDLLEEIKINLLVGCAGACVSGWAPRILIFVIPLFHPYDSEVLCFTIFASLFTISLFWGVFVAHYKDRCDVTYLKNERRPWAIVAFNIFLLLVTIRLSKVYQESDYMKIIKWTNIAFFPICTACMVEFFQVLSGNFMLINIPAPPPVNPNFNGEPERLVEPSAPSEETDSCLECKICMEEFDETKIPRLLKECGHTLCENCANSLLKQTYGERLLCPFCQRVTVVNGPAKLLPKNFTIADMMDNRRAREKLI